MKTAKIIRKCWCGNDKLSPYGPEYSACNICGTLISQYRLSDEQLLVNNDETDFYGKQYWFEHQKQDLGSPDIHTRARNDLSERNLHWLKTLLKYRLPPARVLEIGCAHGSFVALLRQAGYDASGVEMSPWVVEFGRKTFDVPISLGPVETLEIPFGSIDVIALMDVLEHLPDPIATMAHCLELLKTGGLLLLQTPQFKECNRYLTLVENKDRFLEMFIPKEHIYIFSERSITRFFSHLGAEHFKFEPAIFGHYDMFFAVSRVPLTAHSSKEIEAALLDTPHGRLALALMDIYTRESSAMAQLQADKDHLAAQLEASEADRAARLEVIEAQGRQLGRIPQLEAERDHLVAQLEASEADRARLYSNWFIKIGIKTGIVSSNR